MRRSAILAPLLGALAAGAVPSLAAAQAAASSPAGAGLAMKPVPLILVLAALSLLPFAVMTATSYVKISVVLSILRSAIGAQQVPSTTVVSAIAVVLTIFVMEPTVEECRAAAGPLLTEGTGGDLLGGESAARLVGALGAVKEPVKGFLRRNASPRAVKLFAGLAAGRRGGAAAGVKGASPPSPPPGEGDLRVLLPAFLVTELEEAFFIGFLLFLPFLVIELVVSNILLSLGMHMLSPTTVSLPFKLLLFVSVSGWEILSRGLVMGYG